MKKIVSLTLVVVMAFALVACGAKALDMDKIAGLWGMDTINGTPFEDWCAENGLDPEVSNSMWTIRKDGVSVEGNGQKVDYEIDVKQDGFEVMVEGKIFMSVKYDEKADTLSYAVKTPDGNQFNYVMVRYDN